MKNTLKHVMSMGLAAVLAGAMAVGAMAADADPYKIALYGPMTGNNAQYGETYKAIISLYIDKLNEAGGIDGHPVELEVFDDKNDPKEALNVANLIVSDEDIIGVIGSQTSSPTLAAAPVFEEEGIPMITPQGSHPDITVTGDHIFGMVGLASYEGLVIADMMLDAGYKKMAVIYGNDDYGVNIVDTWTTAVEEGGAEVVAAETFVSGQTSDFKPLLSKIKEAGADSIYIEPTYSDAAMILTQMQQLDCDFAAVGSSMLYKEEFLDIAGDAAEGLQLCNYIDPDSTDEKFLEVKNMYEEATGKVTDVYVTFAYDAISLMCDAIAAVGTDGDDIAEWIASVKDYPGCVGPINFDEIRRPLRQLFTFKVEDGKYVYTGVAG